MLLADIDQKIIAWGTAICAVPILVGVFVRIKRFITRRIARWKLNIISEDREARDYRERQLAKQRREATLDQAAALVNSFDGKLTAQTNDLTQKFRTAIGGVQSAVDKKMDEHEGKDVERHQQNSGRLDHIEQHLKITGNGGDAKTT